MADMVAEFTEEAEVSTEKVDMEVMEDVRV